MEKLTSWKARGMPARALPLAVRRLFFGALLTWGVVAHAEPPLLHLQGPDLVDGQGRTIVLRGCNLGNWLLFEAWMMDLARADEPHDHVDILRTLERRFGEQRTGELLDLFRENWIGPRDFALIRSFGFNAVRLPFHYALLEDPKNPGSLRADAFRWLDRAVTMASNAGIYVILDMHGAPGAQSLDHVTGESGRNEFWLPENRRRGAALWEAIARRYRTEPTVVAYDLLNEPYGRLNMEHDDKQLIGAMTELVTAVRRGDPDKLIYCAGSLRGIEVYGPPVARGWRNVGFTEHFYPGFYGDEPSLATQALFLNAKVPARAALLREWNAPYLVGEFNPVLDRSGGAAMLRRYFDTFATQGWAATMWSYKLVKHDPGAGPEPWYLATNAEALSIPSFSRASDAELERFFRSLGTMPYAFPEAQIEALRQPNSATSIALAAAGAPPPDHPTQPPADWHLFDVGDAYPRTVVQWVGPDALTLWGGGRDIYGQRDEFSLLARKQRGNFIVSAGLAFDGISHRYAKAGLMFRSSPDEDSAFIMAHVFPGGRSLLAVRTCPGARISEQPLLLNASSLRLTLRRQGEVFTVIAEAGDERVERTVTLPAFPERGWLGPFVLSHDSAVSAKVDFSRLIMETTQ